ncbi:hypothetical protein PI125_g2778 [Phytophthora idaei]|nr:hypothetical protein PI125_g2778 [Phytophthora idaei]
MKRTPARTWRNQLRPTQSVVAEIALQAHTARDSREPEFTKTVRDPSASSLSTRASSDLT